MVALAWIARPGLCLNSTLVQKIDMVAVEGTQTLVACRASREGRYSETLLDLKKSLESRLRFVERAFEFLDINPTPIRISLVTMDEPLIRVHPSHLILSKSNLIEEGVLEKSILLSILLQRSQKMARDLTPEEALWAEVYSDLVLGYVRGGFGIKDPSTAQSLRWGGRRTEWPFVLRTPEGYCRDGWRSFLHLAACQGGSIGREQVLVALRPLLGSSIFEALMELKPTDRLNWLREGWKHWSEIRFERKFLGSTVGPEHQQIMAESARGIDNFMSHLRRLSHLGPSWSLVSARAERILQQKGFRESPSAIAVDLLLIVGDAESESQIAGLREVSLLTPRNTVIAIQGQEARLLPDLKPFPRVWLGDLAARAAILVQCSIPSIETLKSYAGQVQRLIFISNCDPSSPIAWGQMLKNGLEGFIRENPDVPFIQFHLPSLKTALARKNLNPIPLLREGQWESPFFKEIGWEDPKWDQRLKAYRTRAAIDAIERFRPAPALPAVENPNPPL